MPLGRFYRQPGLGLGTHEVAFSKICSASDHFKVESLRTELCYYVDTSINDLDEANKERLLWLLGTPFEEGNISQNSFLPNKPSGSQLLIEIGPRLNFCTAFSTNAVSICHSIGLKSVTRIEYSTRYFISFAVIHTEAGDGADTIPKSVEAAIVATLHDRMTQCQYFQPLTGFGLSVTPETLYDIDIMVEGRPALEKANAALGLAFDDWDLGYYTKMFRERIKRNPTSVECFDLAQSNSEHSRHWFFKGRMVVDGKEYKTSLFQMVMETQKHSNDNNTIKFSDNSSAIKGYRVCVLGPEKTSAPSAFRLIEDQQRNIIYTAETHNFPTGVAPFPGATTGTGGRIRDIQATGRGAHVVSGTAGYCFGNLHIAGYSLPWEDTSFDYPDNFASGLEVAIEASNGASDYGNKFGEPVLAGFARSCGLVLPSGERREWVKPIMFSGGMGAMNSKHTKKDDPEIGMLVVKVGGPVYRIGVGGGAASSIHVQGDNASHLDFGAVQRGDAEMEQKMNRVIRACIEQGGGDKNPICSIHDQGAGGNGNVLKEICEPLGAEINVGSFVLGDPTLSVLEVWGAEYQETNALLVKPEHRPLLTKLGLREKCDISFVGEITGDGKIRLVDNRENSEVSPVSKRPRQQNQNPVDLELEYVLGSMPRKVFKFDRMKPSLRPLSLPDGLTVREALERVLRLPAVASKRYLTNKVDRSVTGLVAQQQCVGPFHTPLADVAVTALSYFDTVGSATSIGEQPIKGLVDPACGARMSVGEALTNLVWAPITDIKDIKCSGNWMWAAKLPGEGAALVDACVAMCDVMKELGIAIDGGKDSLSMAARVGKETVKAPGALVISAYAACPDITAVVTPDLKCPSGEGSLLYLPLGGDQYRLGGSALGQCYGQIGEVSPDLDKPAQFVKAFQVTQQLIKAGKIAAGHDISDGGLVTCILEMAFAGNFGLEIDIPVNGPKALDLLFAEELGLVIEVDKESAEEVMRSFTREDVPSLMIGKSTTEHTISVSVDGHEVLVGTVGELREVWEETSVQLECLQANPHCVNEEAKGLNMRTPPPYKLSFSPEKLMTSEQQMPPEPPCVAVVREEGSNGDREMVAAFHMAGFQVWDLNMQDLTSGRQTLEKFRGVVFVGGFSYADVCGSAKGWAATMKYNAYVRAEFEKFYARPDTFSLGVCNGCQLMALLGWVAPEQDAGEGVLFTHNKSERFESRFTTVSIEESPSVMLQGMAGSILGIWVAHGEGRMLFKNEAIKDEVMSQSLAPIKYVDDAGQPTETYPLNPNGSPDGIAALCSKDGRHLAMMPHPERVVLPWQWAWKPSDLSKMEISPWLCMFRNAYKWCLNN